MKKNYFLALTVFLIAQFAYSQCSMNLRMYDDWGDGWNGNTITVTVNSTVVLNAVTLASGAGPTDLSFTASTGDTVRTIWNGGGSYGYEVGYEIIANDGSVLFSENMSGVGMPAGATAPSGNSGNNLAVCPSCPAPTGITFTGTTAVATNVSWTSAPALGYGYEYGTSGFTLGTGTQGSSATTSAMISGLTANTTYDFYIKALCTLTDSSTVAGPFSFTTTCVTFSSPWFDGVESQTAGSGCSYQNNISPCWNSTTNGSSSATRWLPHSGSTCSGSTGPSGARTGSNYFYLETSSGSTGNQSELTSGNIDLTGLTLPMLEFYTHMYGGTMDTLYVEVFNGTTWTEVYKIGGQQQTASSDPWAINRVDLSAYSGVISVKFIGTRGTSFTGDMSLDDISIKETPNCPEPNTATLGAYGVTATDANIYWTEAGTATSWRLEYGISGFTIGTGTSSLESNDTVSLSGLSPFTNYEFYVRSLCSAADSSPWSGPYSFTTLCNDTNLGPWMDDLEGHSPTTLASAIANCWSATNTSGFDWNITSGGTPSSSTGALSANSGSNFFYTEASGAGIGDTAILNTPSVDLSSLTTPFMEFYYHMTGAQMGSLSVEVYDGTSWSNELTITGAQQPNQSAPWNQQYIDLSSYSGVIKLRFIAVSNGSFEGDICLDDIAVIESPACFPPAMPMAIGTINDSTTASWMAPIFGTPTKYYIEYGPTGFTLGSGTVDSTTTTMVGISGLTASTTYEYYVSSYCGGTDSSAWVGPISFTTQCDPDLPTYSQDFATYLPTCWDEAEGPLTSTPSSLTYGSSFWIADGFGNVGTTGAARMNIYSTGRDEWLISNPIDLGDGSVPYQVEFDVALTNYASTGPDNMGSDDTLAFVISTDYGQTWSSANALRVWKAGDQPANAGERVFFDLSAYTGAVKFGFYAASSVSNADYDVHIDNFLVTNLCVPSIDTVNDIACGTYTSPAGNIYTTAGTYYDTLQKVRGCDSIIMINLTVNNTTASVSPIVCDSYTAPSGAVYTTSGMYMDTIMNSAGCDSIISINLTVNYSVSVTDVITVCDGYTKPDGTFINYSGTFLDTIPTSLGCDSIVTTLLTVNYTTSSSISATVCASYTSPSGKVWTTSGTRFDTIPNSKGCDSLMTITINVKAATSETRTISACGSYTVPETGMTYTASGTYTDVTTNAFGCPHTITTVLIINTATAGAVTVSGITLTSANTGVTYKWMDCDNEFSYLLGETNQSFTPIRNGNYAVEIETTDGCKDTSMCTMIMSVSLEEYQVSADDISVYPNPANDQLSIDIAKLNTNENVTVNMYDAVGKLVYSRELSSANNKVTYDVSNLEAGIYSVSVSNDYFIVTKKVTVIK